MSQDGVSLKGLTVSQAVLEYLSSIDTSTMWRKRGLRGKRMPQREKQKWQETKRHRIREEMQADSFQKRLQTFLDETKSIYSTLINRPEDIVPEFFPDTEWIFIVGMARTGGTYLLNEMLGVLGEDIQDYEFRMIHDGTPSYDNLAFWKREDHFDSLKFELAQYLTWVRREQDHLAYIPKKRIAFGHALSFLDEIFGPKAKYLLTLRHPAGIAESWAEWESLNTDGIDETQKSWFPYVNDRKSTSKEQWLNLDYRKRLLEIWKQFHLDILESSPIQGNIEPLIFGSDYPEYIKKFANHLGKDYQPGEFSASERSSDDWWSSSAVMNVLEELKLEWKDTALDWPVNLFE